MIKSPSCVTLLALMLSAVLAHAKVKDLAQPGTPTRAIQELDDMLDSYILRPKTDAERRFNADLKKKVLHGTFDIRELCRLALDRHWDELSGKAKDHFVDLMTRLLEKKAIFSKEQGSGKGSKAVYYVTYEGERFLNPEKSTAVTLTFVRIPSENLRIGLNYKLVRMDSLWRIYDVVVDDASLVENYKYQFDKIIREHGYEDLTRRMESKLKEMLTKEGGVPEPPAYGAVSGPPPEEKKGWGCSLHR